MMYENNIWLKHPNILFNRFYYIKQINRLEILAKKWGSTVGKQYVEAFETIRMIV